MGGKLSTPSGDPTVRCPGTEDIHTAYKEGDPGRARHLLREACDESTSQLEKVRSMLTPRPEPRMRETTRVFLLPPLLSWGYFLLCSGNALFHTYTYECRSFRGAFSTCRPPRSPPPPSQGTREESLMCKEQNAGLKV